MAKQQETYQYIIVETFRPKSTAGRHGSMHVRPAKGQPFGQHLFVQCSKSTLTFPEGTQFRMKVKLTDKEDGGEFLYSYFGWPLQVVEKQAL